jgi:DNA repair exonuclease SbcCD ATPase subunit
MKLKELELKNFAKFTHFKCIFGEKITHLVGMNGSGKTTVGLTALDACFRGIAERGDKLIGERFRFIGPAKATSDIIVTLIDEQNDNAEIVIKRKITKTGNELSFKAPEGYHIDDQWLKDLLCVEFMSAKNFTRLSPKEQALVLGIDTSTYDADIKILKDNYTLINRDIRNMGELEPVEKVERVDTYALSQEKDRIERHNRESKERFDEIVTQREFIKETESDISRIEEELKKAKKLLKERKEWLKGMPAPQVQVSTDEINKQIAGADATNIKAAAYQTYVEKKALKDKLKSELDHNKDMQEKALGNRINYIKEFDFGFKGLEVDETGGLLLNGRRIREPEFSKGELEMIRTKLHIAQNPELKLCVIDDYELLDDKNQIKILKELFDAGIQVITTEVGDKVIKDNTILLRECKIAGEEEKGEELI